MLQESKLNRISTPVQVKIPEQVEWVSEIVIRLLVGVRAHFALLQQRKFTLGEWVWECQLFCKYLQ